MRPPTFTLAATLALFAVVAHSQQTEESNQPRGELALSNDTMELRYVASGQTVGVDRSRFSGAFFLSEERDIVISAGLLFPVDLELGRLNVALGPQLYAALLEDENDDVMSMTVGAEARFLLDRSMRLAVAGRAFYGPDILTFGSADSLTDLSARLEVGVGSRATAFGGMRWFEFDLTEGDDERTLQEELFVGFGYRF